jgi:hypothetical protein
VIFVATMKIVSSQELHANHNSIQANAVFYFSHV